MVLTGAITFGQEIKPLTIPLWDGDPPNFIQDAGPEIKFPQWPNTVGNVSVPSIVVYLPPVDLATGVAMIYCSGGSYNKVSAASDDVCDAKHFTSRGVAVVVLKYRTSPPSPDFSAALRDAQRAVRLVRHHAAEWKIDPRKIGMLGGSAGGHLILTLATHWDRGSEDAKDEVERQSCRPDFMTVLCPWPNKQKASEFRITQETPPALICSARDDQIAPIDFAEEILQAYRTVGVSAELWAIDQGGHSAFSNLKTAAGAAWIDQFWRWWRLQGFVK